MNIRTKILILSLVLTIIGVSIFSHASMTSTTVTLEELETVVTNKRNNFTFIGLNESQMYILVFTNHEPGVTNITFTSSGFKYSLDIFIPNDIDSLLTISLYQYSSSTGMNSSSVLYTADLYVIRPSDLNDNSFIIDNLVFIIPILFIAVFTSYIIKAVKSNLK
jgi:hypothetical protein